MWKEEAAMNVSTLNNLDGDVWKMILENLYDAGDQEIQPPVPAGVGFAAPEVNASEPGQSPSREKG
ncbi:MAG TPA: hypothetical protein VN478_03195 [Clostridia bacterium]|nr:hypothetical protein [Clostridia bacterium]